MTIELVLLYGECREGIKLQWRLSGTDRSGAKIECSVVLLCNKLDVPSAFCGVFDGYVFYE